MPLNMTLRQLTAAVKIIAANYFKDNFTKFRGPAGLDGKDGKDGKPGKDGLTIKGPKGDRGTDGRTPQKGIDYFDGKDGERGPVGPSTKPGIRWAGSWRDGKEFNKGDIAFYRDALWIAKKDNVYSAPVEGNSWDLFLRAGSTIVQTRGGINVPVAATSGGTGATWGEHRYTVVDGETLSLTDGMEALFGASLIITGSGIARATGTGRIEID